MKEITIGAWSRKGWWLRKASPMMKDKVIDSEISWMKERKWEEVPSCRCACPGPGQTGGQVNSGIQGWLGQGQGQGREEGWSHFNSWEASRAASNGHYYY